MPLQPIPNQPITFDPAQADPCNIGDDKQYCALYQPCDPLKFQFKQTSCDGVDYFCGGDFYGRLRPGIYSDLTRDLNLIQVNGVASIVNNELVFTGGGNIQFQLVLNGLTSLGASYILTFDVTEHTSDDIVINDGNGNTTITITGVGTYTKTVPSNTQTITFDSFGSFIGKIANIRLSFYSNDCIQVTDTSFNPIAWGGSGWSVDPIAGISHEEGYDNFFLAFVDIAYPNQQVVIEFVGITQGSITITNALGAAGDAVISQNGVYTFYMNNLHFDDRLEFKPSEDFIGTIKNIHVYGLTDDYNVYLLEEDGKTIIASLNSDVTYEEDFMTVDVDTCDYEPGCYRIGVFDPCGENANEELVYNYNFTAGPDQWTDEGLGYVTISNGLITFTGGSGQNEIIYPPAQDDSYFSNINCDYEIAITFGNVDPEYNTGNLISIDFQFGGIGFNQNLNAYSNQTIKKVVSGGTGGGQYQVQLNSNATSSKSFEIKSISVKYFGTCGNQSGINFISNCFNIAPVQDCAKLVQGYANGRKKDLGFYFQPDSFKLSSRYKVIKFNPFYPVESEDFRYSDGYRRLIYAEREKYYEVLFDYVDEDALDALTAMFLCEVFTIDGVQYYVKPENFKPEWDKNGHQTLSQLRVEMRKIGSTIYHSKR